MVLGLSVICCVTARTPHELRASVIVYKFLFLGAGLKACENTLPFLKGFEESKEEDL